MENAVQEAVSPRQKVERLEAVLQQFPQAQCLVRHLFAPGIYLRTMIVPAGVIATGAVHTTEHATIVAGHCLLTTDAGAREIIGYEEFTSKAGAKRAIAAIETTVVTTIHPNPTEERDLDKLCAMLTESRPSELIGGAENRQALMQAGELEAVQ